MPDAEREWLARLDERIAGLRDDVVEFSTKLDDMRVDFREASTKQGERIGKLEQMHTAHETEYRLDLRQRKVERRVLFAITALVQSLIVTGFGVWFKAILETQRSTPQAFYYRSPDEPEPTPRPTVAPMIRRR